MRPVETVPSPSDESYLEISYQVPGLGQVDLGRPEPGLAVAAGRQSQLCGTTGFGKCRLLGGAAVSGQVESGRCPRRPLPFVGRVNAGTARIKLEEQS